MLNQMIKKRKNCLKKLLRRMNIYQTHKRNHHMTDLVIIHNQTMVIEGMRIFLEILLGDKDQLGRVKTLELILS